MCAPLLPALAIASAVVTAGGQIYSGINQSKSATYQAQNYQKLSALKGQQQAAMSANGIDTNFGTALNAQEDVSAIGAQDTGTIYQNTARESKGYLVSAANYIDQAAADRANASSALVGTAFGVAGTALGGATQYGKLKAGVGATKSGR